MRQDWIECRFEDLLNYEQPNKYIVKSTSYSDEFDIPVLTAGKSFIIGYTKETEGVFDRLPVIIFDDFTTASQFVDFKFKVKSSAMKILIPKSEFVNIKFVFYGMQINQIRSDTHKRYWISTFSKKTFHIPPLPIQRAIVSKIENLFSSLDKGIADLKKAQEQLKVYRQAVLKKAFEGEFEIKTLGEVADVNRGKSKHRPRNDKSLFGGKYPFIQTGEVRAANGGTITTFSNTYSDKGLAQSRLWPIGTLCLTIAANIGETAFLGFDACFPDSVVGIKPDNEVLYDKYLNFYIQKIKKEIDNNASATAQKNINVRFLNALEIPLPSLDEQRQKIKEIELHISVCNEIENSIIEAIEKSEALRQSVLKIAFEGRLLNQDDIKRCKQEVDYLPAGELLKKIKFQN